MKIVTSMFSILFLLQSLNFPLDVLQNFGICQHNTRRHHRKPEETTSLGITLFNIPLDDVSCLILVESPLFLASLIEILHSRSRYAFFFLVLLKNSHLSILCIKLLRPSNRHFIGRLSHDGQRQRIQHFFLIGQW